MSFSITPTFKAGKKNANQIITFHDTQNSTVFYQKSNIPFSITLVTCHPDVPDKVVVSFFSPDFLINYSADTSPGKRKSDRMHQHNHFEFMYILDGCLYQLIEGKRFFYAPGSCCLLKHNTLHTEEYTTDFVSIFFAVSDDFISSLTNHGSSLLFEAEGIPANNLIFRFLKSNLEISHTKGKDFLDFIPRINEQQQKNIVHNIFEQMIQTLLNPYYGATYRLQDLFCQLINILSNEQYYNVEHVTTLSNMDSLLFSRINQLLESRNGLIRNSELARILNYNGSYLGRIVKKFTGKSLFSYRMTFTMTIAAKLLKTTDKSILEIAEELHFTNRTHFYKVFEQHFHMTPKQYREQED